MLCALSCRIFSRVPSFAGAERSFKVRSRVHNKSGNRLSNYAADMQRSLIYNAKQFKRVKEVVIAKGRENGVEKMLLLGYADY